MSTGSKTGFIVILMMIAFILFGVSGCGKGSDEKKKDTTVDIFDDSDVKQTTTKNKDSLTDMEVSTNEDGYKTTEYTKDSEEEAKNCKEQMIVLSGRKSDVYKIEEDCYYKGDKYVIYFRKGCVITGDTAAAVEGVMKRLEELYGMSFDNTDHLTTYPWRREFFGMTSYNGINTDNKRVNILVKPYEDGAEEYTDDSVVLLYDKYMDMECGDFGNVIAGLARALRERQSGFMGDIFERGFALYNEEKLGKEYNLADERMIQFIDTDGKEDQFNKSDVVNDPEGVYKKLEEGEESGNFLVFNIPYLYEYGYRFVSFLMETYGSDVVKQISEISTGYNYDYGFVDIELEIIKKATSDDVFTKFAQWLSNDWDNYIKDYMDFLDASTAE